MLKTGCVYGKVQGVFNALMIIIKVFYHLTCDRYTKETMRGSSYYYIDIVIINIQYQCSNNIYIYGIYVYVDYMPYL